MICEIKKGIPQCKFNLPDGKYYLDIRKVDEDKSVNIYRRNYFSIIDEVSLFTGDSKGTLHNRLKDAHKVSSTTSFTPEQWFEYLKNVKSYLFEKLDLMF